MSRWLGRYISAPPHPLHQPIAQHPQAGIRQALAHAEEGPHLGRGEAARMRLEQDHNTSAHSPAWVAVLGRWLPLGRVRAGRGTYGTSGGLRGAWGILGAQG